MAFVFQRTCCKPKDIAIIILFKQLCVSHTCCINVMLPRLIVIWNDVKAVQGVSIHHLMAHVKDTNVDGDLYSI